MRGGSEIASFPGLLCFVLRFVFGIIHRRRRAAKNREGLGNTVLVTWTCGGCRASSSQLHMYKYVCNKPKSKFLTSQVKYLRSCERQRSSLVTEHLMMKSSTLWVSKKGKREKRRESLKFEHHRTLSSWVAFGDEATGQLD